MDIINFNLIIFMWAIVSIGIACCYLFAYITTHLLFMLFDKEYRDKYENKKGQYNDIK